MSYDAQNFGTWSEEEEENLEIGHGSIKWWKLVEEAFFCFERQEKDRYPHFTKHN